MKTANKKSVLVLAFLIAACFTAQPQTPVTPATPVAGSGGISRVTHGGGGYVSGGERGSIVQVIRDAGVQAALNLSQEQRQQVTDSLRRVQATEQELFEDFRRH